MMSSSSIFYKFRVDNSETEDRYILPSSPSLFQKHVAELRGSLETSVLHLDYTAIYDNDLYKLSMSKYELFLASMSMVSV